MVLLLANFIKIKRNNRTLKHVNSNIIYFYAFKNIFSIILFNVFTVSETKNCRT